MRDSDVPQGLRGPVDVVLARAEATIPGSTGLPGGSRYEPKWDGYRMVIVRDRNRCTLWSRQGKDLTGGFPELVDAASAQVPVGTVLDGEAVVWLDDKLSFTALAARVGGSPGSVARAVSRAPASYVAFDVLAVDGQDVRTARFDERRRHLEDLAEHWSPPLNVSPVTDDPAIAARWFEDFTVAGLEGLVVKGGAQPYRPRRRDWVKVKHRSALDVVCGAVIGPPNAPTVVVAGVPLDGALRIVGRTVPLSRMAVAALVPFLEAVPPAEHPWPTQVSSATVNGFGASRDVVNLTLVRPIVVEVAADVAWSGRSFRHPLRFLRVRPDVPPDDVRAPGGDRH